MTLTEARKTLETYRITTPMDDELGEAIDTAITALPRESGRLPVGERLRVITDMLTDAKVNPFQAKKRDLESVIWRRCVWGKLRDEGYGVSEIGKACGYNHSTVYIGVSRLRECLAIGDRPSMAIMADFMTIMGETG